LSGIEEIDLIAGVKSSGEPVSERLPVRCVGDHEYVLVASPVLVLGLAAGDRIEVREGSFEILERGGNLAIQVFGAAPVVIARLREAVTGLGGVLDGQDLKAAVFTVPVGAGFPAVERLFDTSQVEWYYGNVYEADGVTPIGWWDS
jgi:hypothetical protein